MQTHLLLLLLHACTVDATCLEAQAASHIWPDEYSSAMQFSYKFFVGCKSCQLVPSHSFVTFRAPTGVNIKINRVLGGWGAALVDLLPSETPSARIVHREGVAQIQLGSSPPSPPMAPARGMTRHYGTFGGEGALAGAKAAEDWRKAHGTEHYTGFSAREYAEMALLEPQERVQRRRGDEALDSSIGRVSVELQGVFTGSGLPTRPSSLREDGQGSRLPVPLDIVCETPEEHSVSMHVMIGW